MNEDKTCQNCKHFLQHYIIKMHKLHPVNCGVCLYPYNCSYIKTHRQAFDKGCEKWEPDQPRKAEQKERIEDAIRDMERHLKQILQILKSE